MGSYTDVAIAIDKESYAKHALLKKVPKVLAEAPYTEINGALHWYLESQKWYDSFSEVQDVHAFLDVLEQEGDIPDGEDSRGNPLQLMKARYGALLLYESGEADYFGDPFCYGIEHVSYIDCPGRDSLVKDEQERYAAQQKVQEASQ